MVGSDHFHQFWLDNMPQFLVGKAPFYDANFYNEEREFGLPKMLLTGQEDLSAYMLREGLDAGFDLAFSNELRIDHSHHLPDHHPAPAERPADRADLHQHLRPAAAAAEAVRAARARPSAELIESWPSDKRVAVIGTGHLSLELGGPRQFGAARARPGVRPQGRRVDRLRRHRGLPVPRSPSTACTCPATPPTASWTSC